MDEGVLDRHKAFRPGSGWFGWMPSPTTKIITGDEMNQKEKVLGALTYMLARQVDLERAEHAAVVARESRAAAEAELVRVLKAVYGERCSDGVVYKGGRYYVSGDGTQLAQEVMVAEVLG
ncbi:MAG: hypothetical protein WC815_24130 [Vicinamibacterales bacterium]|jgi:hypothetical protein